MERRRSAQQKSSVQQGWRGAINHCAVALLTDPLCGNDERFVLHAVAIVKGTAKLFKTGPYPSSQDMSRNHHVGGLPDKEGGLHSCFETGLMAGGVTSRWSFQSDATCHETCVICNLKRGHVHHRLDRHGMFSGKRFAWHDWPETLFHGNGICFA
jgi:hypothetical protein